MQLLLFLNESFKSECNIEFGFTLRFTKFVIRTRYMSSDALVVLVLLLFLFTPARGLDVFWNSGPKRRCYRNSSWYQQPPEKSSICFANLTSRGAAQREQHI